MLAVKKSDRELIILGRRFEAARADANKLIDALPGNLPVADEWAAIDRATAPLDCLVECIRAIPAYTQAGCLVRRKVLAWGDGVAA